MKDMTRTGGSVRALIIILGLGASPALAQSPGEVLGTVSTQQAEFRVEVVATGFGQPFGTTFLPDGRLLVTDRPAAALRVVDVHTGASTPVSGLPSVYVDDGDGGLIDVVLHPDYERNGWIYFNYAHLTPTGVTMALSRARLQGSQLSDHQRLFTTHPGVPDNTSHLGSRIVLRDGYVFLTMGERYDLMHDAQDLANHHGTVARLHDDGRVPRDNPFAGRPGVRPEIWSFGHRNPQGMVLHPRNGALWVNEHGPQGGDEINVIEPGRNYGWPIITYGRQYENEGGGPIGEGITERAGLEQPIYVFTPSIGPSDMLFYGGDAFPEWNGDLFIGGMALRHLNRLEVHEGRVIHEERLLGDFEWRVRSIAQGPDGLLYIGVDDGMIVRLVP